MPKTITEQLAEFGIALNKLFGDLPQHAAITDTLDYVLGALYAFVRAHELGFKDRKTAHSPTYRHNLAKYALRIPKAESVNRLWTAGFYFNSGIQRLAAAFDRLPQMLGAKKTISVKGKKRLTSAKERMAEVNSVECARWENVYYEVNAFKHSPEGRATGRTVSMNDALSAFDEMLSLVASNKAKLKARYK